MDGFTDSGSTATNETYTAVQESILRLQEIVTAATFGSGEVPPEDQAFVLALYRDQAAFLCRRQNRLQRFRLRYIHNYI